MRLIKNKVLKTTSSYVYFGVVLLSISLFGLKGIFLKINSSNTNPSYTVEAIKEIENQHIDSIFGKLERQNIKVFFRYNKFSCRACLESTISILKDAIKDHNNEFAIIGDFNNFNEREYINKKLNRKIKIFEVKISEDLLIDKFQFSYFFTINENEMIKKILIPEKNFPNITIDYLYDEF